MKKISTAAAQKKGQVEGQKLTSGLELGDRWSWYCVLEEAGEVILEQKLATTPKAMKEVFGAVGRSNTGDCFWMKKKRSPLIFSAGKKPKLHTRKPEALSCAAPAQRLTRSGRRNWMSHVGTTGYLTFVGLPSIPTSHLVPSGDISNLKVYESGDRIFMV